MAPTSALLARPEALPTATAVRRQRASAALVLSPADTLAGDLALVDAAHPVGEAARRVRLAAPFEDQPQALLARHAAAALRDAVEAAGAEGRVALASGFRPAARQRELWDEAVAAQGELEASRHVARPGASEHECGLAADLCRRWPVTGELRLGFSRRGVCQRLREELPRHGFVERYPEGKEGVTGIAAEPWHFRYVGAPHAQAMARLGLTLEEWLALLAAEAPPQRPLAVDEGGGVTPCGRHAAPAGSWLVASVEVRGAFALSLPHPRGAAFARVSGTGTGAVVITWPA